MLPSATYRAGDFLQAARRVGADVVVATDGALPTGALLGTRLLEVALDDPEAAASAIVAHDAVAPLDAVVAVDDRGTVVAALACAELGLPHNAADAVAATRDKLLMRRRLAVAEVPQPAFAVLQPGSPATDAAAVAASVGFPCVVKPTCLSGSQGVIRADGEAEVVAVAERVRRIVANARHDAAGAADPILVERFVPGSEVAIEGLLEDGRLRALAVFDKPDPLDGPYFEETLYVTPSRLAAADVDAALAVAEAACRALGLVRGPVHAEIRVEGGRARVVEVAARTIGGLCSRALTFGAGHRLEELVVAQALGHRVDTTPAVGASGVLMVPIPHAGTFEGFRGQRRAEAVRGIVAVEPSVAPGRRVVPLPEGDRYLGFVFARADSPVQVEEALRRAQAVLDVRVEPEPTAAPG